MGSNAISSTPETMEIIDVENGEERDNIDAQETEQVAEIVFDARKVEGDEGILQLKLTKLTKTNEMQNVEGRSALMITIDTGKWIMDAFRDIVKEVQGLPSADDMQWYT